VSGQQFRHRERRGGGRGREAAPARASAMFFPGRTRRSAASSAVCAAARTSAARPSTGAAASAWTSSECAAVAMKPSMWQPRSLPAHPGQRQHFRKLPAELAAGLHTAQLALVGRTYKAPLGAASSAYGGAKQLCIRRRGAGAHILTRSPSFSSVVSSGSGEKLATTLPGAPRVRAPPG